MQVLRKSLRTLKSRLLHVTEPDVTRDGASWCSAERTLQTNVAIATSKRAEPS